MSQKTHSTSQKAEEHASAEQAAPTSVQPGPTPVKNHEAHTVGAGREEQNRLLKDNFEKGRAQPHPDVPAGQHATGSFTGENKNKK
jgi:hypothetical protein